jgi:hypothetical protein
VIWGKNYSVTSTNMLLLLFFFTIINLHLDSEHAPEARIEWFNHMGLSYEKYGRGNLARKE